jgi:hypothetical protein
MKMPLVKTFIATFGLFIYSLTAVSQESASAENSSALQVKYLGGDNEALLVCFQDNYSAKDFEKKIKIPRLTDTDYVIFLIRSAKDNIQLSYKVKVATKVADETVS